jgi:hypothetical protein
LGLAMATKIITGEEQLIYYHHMIAIMIMAAVFLRFLNQPVFPYLDVTILGIGIFLVCGRFGCVMVGCCHGRPHRWGVCYRQEHADAGFSHYLVGVRLFPIQVFEALLVLCTVLFGTILVIHRQPPGTALACYVIIYGLGRFCLEFMRGDPGRSYLWGFSEAQWTSLVLMGMVVWAELAGPLTLHLWHAAATAGLVFIMITLAVSRRFLSRSKYQLLHPHHIKEVAEIIELVSNSADGKQAMNTQKLRQSVPQVINIGCTSLGVNISTERIASKTGYIEHYALSSQKGTMTEEAATVLTSLIVQLKHLSGSKELIRSNRGVFHLLVHPLTASS